MSLLKKGGEIAHILYCLTKISICFLFLLFTCLVLCLNLTKTRRHVKSRLKDLDKPLTADVHWNGGICARDTSRAG